MCSVVTPQDKETERFLGFCKLNAFDAKNIVDIMEEQLAKHGVEHVQCITQAYDDTSVMCGAVGGVQALFRQNKMI